MKAREGAVSKAELAFLKWKLEQEIEEAGRLEVVILTCQPIKFLADCLVIRKNCLQIAAQLLEFE